MKNQREGAHGGGKVLSGLVKRREQEANIYTRGDYGK